MLTNLLFLCPPLNVLPLGFNIKIISTHELDETDTAEETLGDPRNNVESQSWKGAKEPSPIPCSVLKSVYLIDD